MDNNLYGKSVIENIKESVKKPKKPVDKNAGKMCFAVYGKKLVPKKLAVNPIDDLTTIGWLKDGYTYDVELEQYYEEFEKFIAYIYAFSTPQAMKHLKPIKTKFRNIYVKREEACRR